MHRWHRLIVVTLAVFVGQHVAPAGIRDLSVFMAGEDFAPTHDDWQPGAGWADDIYTATSGDAVLANGGKGRHDELPRVLPARP